jgi:hypothetical protein
VILKRFLRIDAIRRVFGHGLNRSRGKEVAPLITAIIIAGRSGSAYAAQIGTMTVTEEIDAMRTRHRTARDAGVTENLRVADRATAAVSHRGQARV